jgi:hypothetical protein
MKNVLFLFSLAAMLIFASCNKDQQAVKMLDGTWEVSTVNGFPVPSNSEVYHKYTFSNCTLKDDEYCDVKFQNNNETSNFLYKVSEKGTKLTFKSGTEEVSFTIVELEKDKLVTTGQFEGNTVTFRYNKL